MSPLPVSTDILIVGAGPTGLSLSIALRRHGLAAVVIDKHASHANTSRAGVIHARTLEVLDPLGVSPRLLEEGLQLTTFRIRSQNRPLIAVDFSKLSTAYPFVLMCPQDRTEEALLHRLQDLGGSVLWSTELTALRSLADHVEAQVKIDGSTHSISARWVVGCDGMHSMVREESGIAFVGGSYDEDFVLADVHMSWPLGREEVTLFLHPDGLMVVGPLSENRFRIVATVADAPSNADMNYMQAVLDGRGPRKQGGRIHEIVWSSRFRVHHRLAETLQAGRILLCGDAAHVHSPAGGQGMNTGIQDAVALAEPLAEALRSGDPAGLKAWGAARQEIAKSVITRTDRLTRMATSSSISARLARNAALTVVGNIPGVKEAVARTLAQLDNR